MNLNFSHVKFFGYYLEWPVFHKTLPVLSSSLSSYAVVSIIASILQTHERTDGANVRSTATDQPSVQCHFLILSLGIC